MSEYEEGQDPFSVGGSTENVTKESAQKGGGGAMVRKAGFYHVLNESVSFEVGEAKSEDSESKGPTVLVVMTVLFTEEANASEMGKKIYHRIYMKPLEDPENEQKRIAGLASFMFQMGVMTEEEAFGNPQFRVTRRHFELLEGCQSIVKVSHRPAKEYKHKKSGEMKMGKESFDVWNNDVYSLTHEKVKDVPRDWQMAQIAPNSGGGAGGGSSVDDDLAGV